MYKETLSFLIDIFDISPSSCVRVIPLSLFIFVRLVRVIARLCCVVPTLSSAFHSTSFSDAFLKLQRGVENNNRYIYKKIMARNIRIL